MAANGIRYGELERLLRQWGFRLERAAPVPVFRHDSQDALVALPPYSPDEPVTVFHLACIHKLLAEWEIIERAAFERETHAARTS
jgi:hypothetical protein